MRDSCAQPAPCPQTCESERPLAARAVPLNNEAIRWTKAPLFSEITLVSTHHRQKGMSTFSFGVDLPRLDWFLRATVPESAATSRSPGDTSRIRFSNALGVRRIRSAVDCGAIDTPPLMIAETLPSLERRVATTESISLGATGMCGWISNRCRQ